MRIAVVWFLGACGRIGFSDVAPATDGAQQDVPTDLPIDVPIDGGTQPVAIAGNDQEVPYVPGGTALVVDAAPSYDPNGTLTTCRVQWTAGSSTSGSCTGNLGSTVYLPGIYTVTLTVTDNDGLTSTDSKTFSVIAPGVAPPADGLMRFNAGPDLITAAGAPVTFDFSASWNPDGFGYQIYGRDFGDGSGNFSSSNLVSTHTYATPAIRTATYSLQNLGVPMAQWPVDTVMVTVN